MKTSSRLFLLILISGFCFINSFAQEKTGPEHTFNFYFINGYALSYNFCNAESFYLRAHFDISTNKEDLDRDGNSYSESTYDNHHQTYTGNSTSDYFSIGTAVHFIFPVYRTNYGKIYLGAGPMFSYSSWSSEYSDDHKEYFPDTTSTPTNYKSTSTSTNKGYDAGALILVGVEAVITKSISLFAEAHFKGGRRWQDSNGKQTSNTEPDYYSKNRYEYHYKGWFYDAQFIRLGVSVSI